MFRRSKTRPRPPKSETQSPMRNAIEQELGSQPQSPQHESERHLPEKKQARTNDAPNPKMSTRPLLKTPSKSKTPPSPARGEKPPLEKQDKAVQNYEVYITKAKEADIRGDAIQSEQYYQQADHYRRQMHKK